MSTFQDPRLDQVIDYLVDQEEREWESELGERAAKLREFAEANPDIATDPQLNQEVTERVLEIAERAGDEALLTDPAIVKIAYAAAKADRGETAQAAAEAEPSHAEQVKAEIAQQQTRPFDDRVEAARVAYDDRGRSEPPSHEERVAARIEERGGDPEDYGDRTRAEISMAGGSAFGE